MQALLFFSVTIAAVAVLGEVDARFAGQKFERAPKVEPLHLHDKAKHIAALAGAKVVPNLLFRADHKARCALIAKGAQAFKVAAGTLKLDVLAHDVLNAQTTLYVLNRVHYVYCTPLHPWCTDRHIRPGFHNITGVWLNTGMNPDQQFGVTPPPANYDFIVNPAQPPKKSGGKVSNIANNAFIMKLLVIIGGTVVLIIGVTVLVNVIFGNKTNYNDLIGITQTENELIRVSAMGAGSNSASVRNAAVNTRLTLISQQGQWLTYLAKFNHKVPAKQLALKKNTNTDKQLSAASAGSTFTVTYIGIMRKSLTDYAGELKTAYTNAAPASKVRRSMLNEDYKQVVLLLQQWPTNN